MQVFEPAGRVEYQRGHLLSVRHVYADGLGALAISGPGHDPVHARLAHIRGDDGASLVEHASDCGFPTIGGPVTAASGLAFMAGTQDYYLRAFDGRNGRKLWKGRLPVSGETTPMTYLSPRSGH
ncbi:hypothetical protein P3W85_27640 [Cupriavidus basilensis]|uniref:Pyrrolo-quinoline quinone repeat domain-containing protein n=1 Tax=Cupriavidus basilensis TaxID=68895 RepID=A0ABT6AVP9_9BURK|nr:hypothetical protein [Cupriavidus basilensis]MDF3836700.1 hypothetical protein [Cupriavidus basilensis]